MAGPHESTARCVKQPPTFSTAYVTSLLCSRQSPQACVPHHPLIKHFLALARDQKTATPIFRNALSELGRMLIYEAVRDCLPTAEDAVDTPVGRADVEWVDESSPIKVVRLYTG